MKSIFLILTLSAGQLQAQELESPRWIDNDSVVRVEKAAARHPSDILDLLIHSFATPGDRSAVTAVNINSLGEVPDSSWFQNRHGRRRMTLEELTRGPNTSSGPSLEAPWEVIAVKSEGVTPGLRIKDARGDVYVVKFDPINNPEMASAAEVISTKFLHAIGYNVPENYITSFVRHQLKPGAGSGVTEAAIGRMLRSVPKRADGTYRGMASKLLKGEPLGPFRYYGTRSDDPNDIFAHENRRELRGLRMVAAWLNHDDSRAINTLDMLVSEEAKRYIRHYLIDFGSTLGSGSLGPQGIRPGWEYLWSPAAAMVRAASFGMVERRWARAYYVQSPSLGRLDFELFQPEQWKPEYPNPAFLNARDEDSYWAAKIIMAFTDDDIRAIVHTGELSAPLDEAILAQWLIERRDKIGRYWFSRVSTIDRFGLTPSGDLGFEHLASVYGFAAPPELFHTEWINVGDDHALASVGAQNTAESVDVWIRVSAAQPEIVRIERKAKGGR